VERGNGVPKERDEKFVSGECVLDKTKIFNFSKEIQKDFFLPFPVIKMEDLDPRFSADNTHVSVLVHEMSAIERETPTHTFT
jgi:hypothetical protein